MRTEEEITEGIKLIDASKYTVANEIMKWIQWTKGFPAAPSLKFYFEDGQKQLNDKDGEK
jgi:hypothetical protein